MQLGVLLREIGIGRFDNQRAAGGHGVSRIHHQVHEHLMKLSGIRAHVAGILRQGQSQHHVLADHAPQHLLEVFDQVVQTEHHRLEHLLAAERQQLAGESGRSLGRFANLREIRLSTAVRRHLFSQQVDVSENRCEDVVEVMRHAARQPPDGFHFLRLPQLPLELLAVRDVLEVEQKVGCTSERDHLSRQQTGAHVARTGQPLHLDIAEETTGSEPCQHTLPELLALPEAQLVPRAPDRLGPVHPEQAQQAFVHIDPAGVRQSRDRHWRGMRLKRAAELCFGHAQCLVRHSPVSDIPHEGAEQPGGPDLHGGHGELHRKFTAIAPQRVELDALVQNGPLASGEEAAQSGGMRLALGRRHNDVGQAPTNDVLLDPSEHGFGLPAPARDQAGVIHGDVGIEGRPEYGAEPRLRRPQRLLDARPLDCGGDLCRYELEHLFVVLLVTNSRRIGLYGKHTDGPVSLFEGYTQPVDGGCTDGFDRTEIVELRLGLRLHEQWSARAQHVLGNAAAGTAGSGRGIDLVDVVWEGDQVARFVVERNVEVLCRHQLAHDLVDRGQQFFGPRRAHRHLGNAIGGGLQLPRTCLRFAAALDVERA